MTRCRCLSFAGLLVAVLALLLPVGARHTSTGHAAPASCTELIQNGSFEDGGLGWQQTSAGGYDLISDFNPRTGRWGAYLAGVNNADDRLSQQVTLLPGTIRLQAWWYLATAETAGAFDSMTVSLLRPDGSWLADLALVDNTAPVGVWDEIVADLSAFSGQTVILRFVARTDDNNISDFYLDDISITACAQEPTPTETAGGPTPTATPTPPTTEPTATPSASATPTASVTPTFTRMAGRWHLYLPYITR